MRRSTLVASMAGLCLLVAGSGAFAQTIDCNLTPFGKTVPLLQSDLFTNLYSTSTGTSLLQASQPGVSPALLQLVLQGSGPTGSTFLKAMSVDLNGDGRDEAVAAYRMTADGSLRLAIFQRSSPSSSTATIVDSWSLAGTFGDVALAAGDFQGSNTPGATGAAAAKELAVLVRSATNSLSLHVLTGDVNGHFAQADNADVGHWSRSGPVGKISLATGDMLLDGRDQLIVVSQNGASGLIFDLLEYATTQPALPVTAGDSNIGSKSFPQSLNGYFNASNGGGQIDNIDNIVASAGDLVDTAAAELVVHLQFDGQQNNYIGQRLHHFVTTRALDANNNPTVITGIALQEPSQTQGYDSSLVISGPSQDVPEAIAATIANIDGVAPGKILLARADPNGFVSVSAYQAAVDVFASFSYASTSAHQVAFTDTSSGVIVHRIWDFDGASTSTDINPVHTYSGTGPYTVTLKAYQSWDPVAKTGTFSTYSTSVQANGTSGTAHANYTYHVVPTPVYSQSYTVSWMNSPTFMGMAVADMNLDGVPEVMTVAVDSTTSPSVLRSIWHLTNVGDHGSHSTQSITGITNMAVVAADMTGASVHANVGADCRTVSEKKLRQVVWQPPYFSELQKEASKSADWGNTTSGSYDYEQNSSSYTANSISGSIGAKYTISVAGEEVFSAEAKVTAGHEWQATKGANHGHESEFEIDQSWTLETEPGLDYNIGAEALVVYEQNDFACYTYDVSQYQTGIDHDSAMRMCQPTDSLMFGKDALTWDTTTVTQSPGSQPPAEWTPLQRDWNNLALFRQVTSNVLSSVDAGSVTDGRFSTSAQNAAQTSQPYLQIDLGSVRDISNIRVWPTKNAGQNYSNALNGFQLYVSTDATAMSVPGTPSGPSVHNFTQATAGGAVYDRWNIWTRSATADLLPARYIRLQSPGLASLKIDEIQVFGDVHAEPPAYPLAVCEPTAGVGYFNALVWNPLANPPATATIEVHGDLLWDGTLDSTSASRYPGCHDDTATAAVPPDAPPDSIGPPVIPTASINANAAQGSSTAAAGWSLSSATIDKSGLSKESESSTQVGAEFDVEAGFALKVTAGLAYDYTTGATSGSETGSSSGTGLEVGGSVGGWDDPIHTPDFCTYVAQPYAFRLTEKSNVGYAHEIYVVDYIVPDGTGTTRWKRNSPNLISLCMPGSDDIFKSGFE